VPAVGASARAVVARGFTYVEDVLYIGLGVLLAAAALVLLADGAVMFWRALVAAELPARVIELLDRILLILMIAEILYTVQVSLREHTLVPEPFLVVALIAAVRRVLIITAEFADLVDKGPEAFRNAMIELGLLTVMIVALVASLMLLRRRQTPAVAPRT
jgi:phosphate starvation-inducible membrane PsiE